MESGTSKTSCLGSKFLLSNLKKEKEDIVKRSLILKMYSGEFVKKDEIIKEYFDTIDYFFHAAGINIGVNSIKSTKSKEIVVRYDSEKERVSFLNYMPDTYTLTIDYKDNINNHLEFVSTAISEMIINGLQINILEKLKEIKVIFTINKKRERYHYIGNNGLNLNFSFDYCDYFSPITKDREKMELLEILSENPKEQADSFNEFTKKLCIENPTIVKTHDSDLFIALDYLLNLK